MATEASKPALDELGPALDSGRPVVISEPTDDELGELARITGLRVAGTTPVVGYVKDRQGAYHPCVAQQPEAAERALAQFAAGSDALVGDGGSSLIPTFDCQWGRQSFAAATGTWLEENPNQTIAGASCSNWVYAYLVDSVKPAYYVVIVVQQGTTQAGEVAENTENARGWFLCELDCGLTISGPDASPLTSGVTALGRSPATVTSQPGFGVPIQLQTEMMLRDSHLDTRFTATVSDSLTLSDWGVEDISDPSVPTNAAWAFHQVTAWDPIADPPETYNDWKGAVVPHGRVVAMPDASFGSVQFEAASAWQFEAPLVSGHSLPLMLEFDLTQYVALLSAKENPVVASYKVPSQYSVDIGSLLGKR